uniref:Sorting nexin-29 n=1 Tax=Anopheles atroparvus TaxID=41427 RepID=A0A182J7H1_ANOAO
MVGMSNFSLSSSAIESMIGVNLGLSGQRREQERKELINELLATVQECQRQYGSKTELATEHDTRILALCDVWERVLSHGLRSTGSMLQNVVELVGGGVGAGTGSGSCSGDGPFFWDFAFRHLTNHEKERFSSLRHVKNRRGRGRALLRAILNERALERYVLIWLGDEHLLSECYEAWAVLRDGEVQSLLPNMAAGLSTILFAIAIDTPELNVAAKSRALEEKPEPIIATRRPVGPVRKINAVKREILEDIPQQRGTAALGIDMAGTINPKHAVRSESIDIIREHTHSPAEREDTRGEACSVEEALNSLHLARESTRGRRDENFEEGDEQVTLRYRKVTKNEEEIPSGSGAQSPETAEDSILSGYACSYSLTTTATSTGTSESGESEMHRSVAEERNRQTRDERLNDLVTLAASHRHEIDRYDKLKHKYHELEERCHLLESRVAELSLENHRLRMLTRSNRLSVAFFSFSIPKAIQRTPSSGRTRRPYHVYEIRITPSGVSGSTVGNESWCIYRRYNEFYRLHRRLQKEYPTVKTLDFPPKKKLGNMNADFVEQRRQRLQVYLNSLFVSVLPEVSSCNTRTQLEETFPFLYDQPT